MWRTIHTKSWTTDIFRMPCLLILSHFLLGNCVCAGVVKRSVRVKSVVLPFGRRLLYFYMYFRSLSLSLFIFLSLSECETLFVSVYMSPQIFFLDLIIYPRFRIEWQFSFFVWVRFSVCFVIKLIFFLILISIMTKNVWFD